jgi:hypothetical protein
LTAVPTSEGRLVVEVAAAFGLPLPPLSPLAIAALAGPLDLGRGPPEGGADLIGFDLGDRALVALWGLLGALPEPPGDHDPVAFGEGVGQVFGLRQTLTLKEVSLSRHSPSCWMRWVTATRRLATTMPVLVKRSSGSSTRSGL